MPKDSHFIKNVKLTNYKTFDNFEVSGFKRVNLIGGCNNIGKTAFMEACYINLKGRDVNSFISVITGVEFMRQNINLFIKSVYQKGLNHNDLVDLFESHYDFLIKTNIRKNAFNISNKDGKKEYVLEINDKKKAVLAQEVNISTGDMNNIGFTDNLGLSDLELKKKYESVQLLEKENKLNKYINKFDSGIESFKFIGDVPKCKLKKNGKFYSLTSFGDGLKSYISIICALYASKDGQLFIDEVDNGIHYTQFDNVWKIIFELSKEVNCQVFAVTHSREMIESFNHVQNELNEEESIYFELAKNKKDNTVMMNEVTKEQLEYELTHNGRFRGE